MADQPKSTADILAAIRKRQAGGGQENPPPADESASAESASPAQAESPAPEGQGAAATESPQPAAEKPKGTSDILAAIRARSAGAAKPEGGAAEAPKSAAGGAPKGASDILAAIRGKGAAAKSAPAAAKPAAEVKPVAPKPAGEKPSVQEMLKAVRAGKPASAARVPPRLPGKPVVAKKPAEAVSRRNVFAPILSLVATPFAFAWTLLGLVGGIMTLKGAQYMMPNMVLELPSRFKVGVPSDYPLNTVSEKYKAARGVWIVHTDTYDGSNIIYALASVCTHLGCTPNWLEGEQKFKCPCHGSGFYINGVNFEGPAPRPLERVGLRVAEDGQLEVDKSVKFQEELGQWADPNSYVELV